MRRSFSLPVPVFNLPHVLFPNLTLSVVSSSGFQFSSEKCMHVCALSAHGGGASMDVNFHVTTVTGVTGELSLMEGC